ncbi:MAG: DUF4136 domain-containing protein [Pseudomonadota bacterium]
MLSRIPVANAIMAPSVTVKIFFATLGTLLVSACTSSPPQPTFDYKSDYDFRGVNTIAFMPQSGTASGDSPRAFISDMVADRIDQGITNALQSKGLKVIDDTSKADALITWHLVANEKTDVRTYNTGPSTGVYYGGYRGYNRAAFYNCWNCNNTDVSVRQYTQGTFIVDIIDPELKRSVWRSTIESKLRGKEPSRDQADYDQAASRIMGGFPPY